MRDRSRAKTPHQVDADGTEAEDKRQLTQLLLQNAVSLNSSRDLSTADEIATARSPWSARLMTALTLFVAMPFALLAYSTVRGDEDDFYA